ncbi:hypothetical protein OsccyDRAFT_2723 [Leptolyngbyaceae cyanobacterium JSC-12]|nr:hypothetical protein OsccyDRAFT_2723 [Leptolyngbyaceae cyanobacterium JSC-12]
MAFFYCLFLLLTAIASLLCLMTFNDAPLLIAVIATAYLAIIYFLLTLAQRSGRMPRPRD